MGNVIGTAGKIPKGEKLIRDMRSGEVGYTVEWAYDLETGELDESYSLHEKLGTASLRVECVRSHTYSLTFETPVYRKVF